MSQQLFKEDVLFYQRFLKVNGFYNDTLDGIWGPNTDKADMEF
jgi:peptidoglycan L-alanyl-D-glutamate endopeptidase CwlK